VVGYIEEKAVGDTVELEILRNNSTMTVSVTLEEKVPEGV
jgi:S1-C subfamily serine protease